MSDIEINGDAVLAVTLLAREFGIANNLSPEEMGKALLMAGRMLLVNVENNEKIIQYVMSLTTKLLKNYPPSKAKIH